MSACLWPNPPLSADLLHEWSLSFHMWTWSYEFRYLAFSPLLYFKAGHCKLNNLIWQPCALSGGVPGVDGGQRLPRRVLPPRLPPLPRRPRAKAIDKVLTSCQARLI